ncbi:ice-binding family protein, partial [Streptomyces scabiei]|uniref:ice-binding family protein n=1 Tax=Streptomyces scabiei TaxID=1930 RepID=UPI0038F6B773
VLGASTVTNTGPTRVEGDLGLSPGTSLNGFGGPTGGVVTGAIHQTDADAERAQGDAAKAYGVAASLTPTQTGLGELDGLSLTPGVYDG